MENVDVKFWKKYQQMQKILRYAYDIVLFIMNRYFTCLKLWTFKANNYICEHPRTHIDLYLTSHF